MFCVMYVRAAHFTIIPLCSFIICIPTFYFENNKTRSAEHISTVFVALSGEKCLFSVCSAYFSQSKVRVMLGFSLSHAHHFVDREPSTSGIYNTHIHVHSKQLFRAVESNVVNARNTKCQMCARNTQSHKSK